MSTSAERQRKFRERKRELGLAPVTVLVPAELVADIQEAARQLCASRGLELGPLRESATGKLVKRK